MLDYEPRPSGSGLKRRRPLPYGRGSLLLCAHDGPSTINGGAARLALQTRNIVLEILANDAEMQKEFFGGTIFHSKGVARLALQTRSAPDSLRAITTIAHR